MIIKDICRPNHIPFIVAAPPRTEVKRLRSTHPTRCIEDVLLRFARNSVDINKIVI